MPFVIWLPPFSRHIFSLNDLIYSQDFNILWIQMTPSVTPPARAFLWFQTCIFNYSHPVTLTYLPHSDLKVHISKIDHFQISILTSDPFLPSPLAFPVLLSLLLTHCSGQIPESHLWFLTPHSVYQCGLLAYLPEHHRSFVPRPNLPTILSWMAAPTLYYDT